LTSCCEFLGLSGRGYPPRSGRWERLTVLCDMGMLREEKGGEMAQGNRPSQPKTTCCRCRRRAEGMSRLTNLGWLCDNCYELLHRSELGRRIYRLVYQLSSGRTPLARPVRRTLVEAEAAGRPAPAPRRVSESGAVPAREEPKAEAVVR
jgi:hypothetical protein